jgi:hypothetical protein
MEKATLTPFSKRGRGSAFRSQKVCWSPFASRLVSLTGGGDVVLAGLAEVGVLSAALGGCRFDFTAFFGGGGELCEHVSIS